jgi:DNA-binding NarL/FixJ family response regulator
MVVILSMHDEPGMVGRFMALGAAGYLSKSAEMDELVEAVRAAARGRPLAAPGWGVGG